jgi:predicted DNA binding CopG/RHH family protein
MTLVAKEQLYTPAGRRRTEMAEKYTDAQKRAAKKYLSKMDELKIRMAPGTKDRWRDAAEARGLSLQRFIIDAVEAAIRQE